ncbi:MAG: hypothetical protein ACK48X_08625, partial [Planctomycetota bacterium]
MRHTPLLVSMPLDQRLGSHLGQPVFREPVQLRSGRMEHGPGKATRSTSMVRVASPLRTRHFL